MLVLPASRKVQPSTLAPELGATQARLAEEREFGNLFPDLRSWRDAAFGESVRNDGLPRSDADRG
jgi:hypothetical protein